jgi:hypothetical protein
MLKKREHFSVSSAATRGHRDGKAAHWHPEGQLSAVADGLLIISVEGASLMLPPRRIGWIPPETVHAGASYGTRMDGLRTHRVQGSITRDLLVDKDLLGLINYSASAPRAGSTG